MDGRDTGRQKIDILIVEDSLTQAEHLRFILEGAGFGVLAAPNGREALALLTSHRPDIVLSDIVMPEMDGYELCRQIRAESSFAEMPVILVTGLSDPRDVIRGLEAGANNFVTKPYDEKALLSRIDYLIANRNLRRVSKPGTVVDILFSGQNYHITADRLQILDLLLSTYENAHRQNDELRAVQIALTETNRRLEETIRELDRAHSEAESERRRLEAVMEALPVGMAITDVLGSHVRFNAAFERVWGGTPPDVHSLDKYAAGHAWWADTGEAVTAQEWASAVVLKEGAPIVGQLMEIERFDGSRGFIINSAAPIRGPEGEIQGAAVAIEDITELKRTEDALKVNEAIMEAFFDASPGILNIEDDEFRYIKTDRVTPTYFGLDRQTIVGKTVAKLSPEFIESYGPMMKRVIETGEPELNIEVKSLVPSRPGELAYWLASYFPIPLPQSKRGIGVTGVEITAIKKAEEALRQARDELEQRVQERTAELVEAGQRTQHERQRFLNVLDTLPVILVIIRPDHRIEWTNRAYREALGDNGGRLCFEGQFGRDEPCDECQAFIPLSTGRLHHWEWTLPNGRTFDIHNFPFVGEDGSPLILEMDIDMTEQRNAEKERAQLEAQLRQAQKMEALGTLSGGIAHDFNNLLSAIIGFTELIKDHTSAESREHRHAQRVLEAGIRGRELVRQMLTFSRQTEPEKKPLRLSSIVRESTKLLRASIPSTVSIRTGVKSESGVILGDPTQISQVLMNLCTNAAYAMRESGGTLDIELSDYHVSPSNGNPHGIEPGPYMKLTVRDTGTGMPPEIVDRIFDPFFTTKGVGEGTGLGLSVVLGIVKQADGYITVESEPGKGSTFDVYFPKLAEKPGVERVLSEDTLPLGSERILLVDDEEALVEMGEELLAGLGYEVVSRTNGGEALTLFKIDPSRFDLVITDQTMPDMTGIQLAAELLVIRPDIPVILCTGFSHTANEESAKAVGIRGFVMKPLTKREIAKAVRKVLDR